jgi:GNAT superfamily N-acetyltransferase
MQKRTPLTRLRTYFQKKGFLRTFLRLFGEPYRIIFKTKVVLLYADLSEVSSLIGPSAEGINIECKKTYDEATEPDMQKAIDYWEEENMLNRVKERFNMGAILYILRYKGDIAAFAWSIMGKFHRPWFLPLTPHDAYCFDAFTFKEYRGRGFHPRLTEYRFNKMKIQGARRAFCEIYTWNKSSLSIIKTSDWKIFGEARRFRLFGRNVTIWRQHKIENRF